MMERMRNHCVCLAFAGCVAAKALAGGSSIEVSRLDGELVKPFEGASRAVVLLFLGVDCPISNRYAPAVNRLVDAYSKSSIDFWAVYSDPYFSIEEIVNHRKEYGYELPALKDFSRLISSHCGATVTPEAVVYVRESDGTLRMVYRGRIDDRYTDFGKWRLKATETDLEDTLRVVSSEETSRLAFRETRAVGCYIGN